MGTTSARLCVASYDADFAPAAAETYNRVMHGVPHCFPISAEEFATAAAPSTGEQDHKRLVCEAAFVALEGTTVRGYAHAAVGYRDHHATAQEGILPCLWYEAGHRSAGQALLEAAESHLMQSGMTHAIAFPQGHRYPIYHLPSAYLSDHLGHIGALLGRNGYHRTAGEVYMDWPNYAPPKLEEPELSIDVGVEWRAGQNARPGLVLSARHGERDLGVCHSSPCSDYTNVPEAQGWFFTTWIGVEDEVQGKGVGRHLLQRTLLEMHEAGYRHAVISTARHNYRAALFYTNLGYRVVDWTYAYERELEKS